MPSRPPWGRFWKLNVRLSAPLRFIEALRMFPDDSWRERLRWAWALIGYDWSATRLAPRWTGTRWEWTE